MKKITIIRLIGYLWLYIIVIDIIFFDYKHISQSLLGTTISGVIASKLTDYKKSPDNETISKKNIKHYILYSFMGNIILFFYKKLYLKIMTFYINI